jgi:hypothetical protein
MNFGEQPEFDFEAEPATTAPKNEATAAIIERIKKLLRLGADKRGNPHEAERAMQLAFELSEKYRVDMQGLDLDENTEKVMHEAWAMGARYDRIRRGVCGILMVFFHVDVVVSRPELLIVGKPTDVLIAHYVYDFLLRACRDCLKSYEAAEKVARRRVTTGKKANYLQGFFWGVSRKLRESKQDLRLSDSQDALVLDEDQDRERYVDVLCGANAVKLKALPEHRRHDSAIDAGYRAGLDTTIHQPLNATPGAATLLLQ